MRRMVLCLLVLLPARFLVVLDRRVAIHHPELLSL